MNFKLKLIDKYLFSQILKTTLIGMILFIVIWVSPEILARIVRRVISHEYTVLQGMKIFLLEIPLVLGKAIPMGLLLGCLGVFDSMSKHFELTTFRSIGVSFKRLLVPIIAVSLIFAALSYITFNELIPYSRKILDGAEGSGTASQFVYVDKDANDKPRQIIIVSSFDGKKLYNLNVLKLSTRNDIKAPLLVNIYKSPLGLYKNNALYLVDGTNYVINKDNIFKQIDHFDSLKIVEGQNAKALMDLMKFSKQKNRNLTGSELSYYLKLLKQEGMHEEYNYNLNKFYQRTFDSISCIFLAVLGCILGYARPREKRLFGFTTAVGVIFAYYIIIPLLDLLAQKGILAPIFAAAIPCLIVIGAIYASLEYKDLSLLK